MSSIEKEYEFRETPQELLANEDLTENIFQNQETIISFQFL